MPTQSLDEIFKGNAPTAPTATALTPQASGGKPSLNQIFTPGVFQPKQTPQELHLADRQAQSKASGAVLPENLPNVSQGTAKNFLPSLGQGISQTSKNLTDPLKGGVNNITKDTSEAFKGGVKQIAEGAGDINQGKNPFEATLKMGAGVVNTAFSPLAAPFEPVGNLATAAADKLSSDKTIQNFANSKAGEVTSRVAEDVGNLATVAQGVGGAMGGGSEAKAKLETGLNKTAEVAKPGVQAVADKASKVGSRIVDTAQKVDTRLGGQASSKAMQSLAKDASGTAGKIVQGDVADVSKAHNALTQIDTSKVKTYQDLVSSLDTKIKEITNLQDKAYETRPENIHIDDLTSKGHNFVNDALDQLKEYYQKTNNIDGQQKIKAVESKAMTQGLSVKEVNDLARLHGKDLNGYNANGELASGLTKQAAENTRQGLKSTARAYMGDAAMQGSDAQLTDLIRTKDLVKQVGEKVNDLQQKIQQRGLIGKIGYGASKIADLLTGGFLKNAVDYFVPRGAGLKTLNALDLEKTLQSNLKNLNNLTGDKLSNADFTSKLNDLIKKGNQQKLLPEPKPGSPKESINTPISQPSRIIDNSADKTNIPRSRIIKPKYIKGGGNITNIGPG